MASEHLEDKILKLDKFFRDVNDYGMEGKAGSVWPVIIRRTFFNQEEVYEYCYPYPFFENLSSQCGVSIPYKSKSERRLFLKMIIDKKMSKEIDIYLYHFGMYLLYGMNSRAFRIHEELNEKTIGKKRFQFIQSLPISRFKSTEDFISEVWADQIKRWDTDLNEYRYNPSMSEVRILFSPEQFGNYTGTYYENVDWVEPISGALALKCKTYTKETDPMKEEKLSEEWLEGPIILGHEGQSGYRHFVAGEPIHAGTGIRVKFGKGWIDGRYEWSFMDKKDPIQIHCGDEVIYIKEGHLVRIHR